MFRSRYIQSYRFFSRTYATATSPHTLVFLEHRQGVIDSGSLSALTAAEQLGGKVTALVVGGPEHVPKVLEQAKKCVKGVKQNLVLNIHTLLQAEGTNLHPSLNCTPICRSRTRSPLSSAREDSVRFILHTCRLGHLIRRKVSLAPCSRKT